MREDVVLENFTWTRPSSETSTASGDGAATLDGGTNRGGLEEPPGRRAAVGRGWTCAAGMALHAGWDLVLRTGGAVAVALELWSSANGGWWCKGTLGLGWATGERLPPAA
jgi:hypothetical protein